MALKFKGTRIPGLHGPLVYTTSEPMLRFANFWDLPGEVVIAGKTGGRNIGCTILLYDQWTGDTPKKLYSFLDDLNKLVGQHGKLEETGRTARDHDRCTFLGFEPLPIAGQEEPGPLRDEAFSLWPQNDLDEAEAQWWIHGVLRWRQAKA